MIEADKNELFPITVTLLDEGLASLIVGQSVIYDIRTMDDLPLDPPISGTLSESTVEGGIYKTQVSIPTSGTYICYATCSGFITSTEEIRIKEESYTDIAKYNFPHNLSVLNVPRVSVSGTVSQLNRNVALGNTDYIVTKVKADAALDWSSTVASGITFAWYESLEANLPYMMGGEY